MKSVLRSYWSTPLTGGVNENLKHKLPDRRCVRFLIILGSGPLKVIYSHSHFHFLKILRERTYLIAFNFLKTTESLLHF